MVALIAHLQLKSVVEETANAPVLECQHFSPLYGRVVLLSLEDLGQLCMQICNSFFDCGSTCTVDLDDQAAFVALNLLRLTESPVESGLFNPQRLNHQN